LTSGGKEGPMRCSTGDDDGAIAAG